ncbi:MAG: helicase-exonuclease AddAB subunit AddA [Butyrivibrio sp.]|nr:helicase-exonuclease AddAB subunit AddA [Butyrivibrio sp.]
MNFTPEQQAVIDARDCSLLVSAAAGSGKTAVLVQRILERITGPEQLDVDTLLVVTFTRAAAAEMKDRLRKAIGALCLAHPDDRHLRRQENLIHAAQITTIDSFCQTILRGHFDRIDADPASRVADEGECRLLREETLAELLEEEYGRGDETFLRCMTYFAAVGADDDEAAERILHLADAALSMPWPEEWLTQHGEDYAVQTAEEFEDSALAQYMYGRAYQEIADAARVMEALSGICEEPDGPYVYAEMIAQEAAALRRLATLAGEGAKDCSGSLYERLYEGMHAFSFGRLSSKKDESIDAFKRGLVKEVRDVVKKNLKSLTEDFFPVPLEQLLAQAAPAEEPVRELCRLSRLFLERFAQKKRTRGVIDFSDMEHYALQILLERVTGEDGEVELRPSDAALTCRASFREVMIDEYQDSNMVQELLLSAVAGTDPRVCSRFMVGDVKQSIYRFRQARPDIFLEQYRKASPEDGAVRRRIDLHRNFRSRPEVTDAVNHVFRRIMGADLGGVDYDDDAALVCGRTEAVPDDRYRAEVLLLQADDAQEQEARMIAWRIRRLMAEQRVPDKDAEDQPCERPIRYGDIVILLRTMKGWDEVFRRTLEEQGIPVAVETSTGYFSAREVVILLQLLTILDNPMQDIPLAAVLRSELCGFSDDLLARIRICGLEGRCGGYYGALTAFAGTNEDGADQARAFLEKLGRWRDRARFLQVHELLQEICEETGFLRLVSAMPGGAQRLVNVEELIRRAKHFEETNYRGLFRFLRYMDKLRRFEVDYGEPATGEAARDAVRIMSIHKSKGLEFPVVFVSGCARKFNMRDAADALKLDMDLGIGVNIIRPEKRLYFPSLRGRLIADRLRTESMGEELRILYVAMTRAREQLIMTGVVKNPEAQLRSALQMREMMVQTRLLPCYIRRGAQNTVTLLLSALASEIDAEATAQLEAGIPAEGLDCGTGSLFRVQVLSAEALQEAEAEETKRMVDRRDQLEAAADPDGHVKILQEELRARFEASYPHGALEGLYAKTTVTELKEALLHQEGEQTAQLIEMPEADTGRDGSVLDACTPRFIHEISGLSANTRGSAYHKVMELLDTQIWEMAEDWDAERFRGWMAEQVRRGRMPAVYADAVVPEDVCRFVSSDLGRRLYSADREGRLYRERPFMMGVPASERDPALPAEETVLIQGIIDAWFIEAGEVVILDYKTDHVRQAQVLADRYRLQLDYYERALRAITGKPVRERLLWSFALGREIAL